jgi:hypothetical protein
MSGPTRLASIAAVSLVIGSAAGAMAESSRSELDTREIITAPNKSNARTSSEPSMLQPYVTMPMDESALTRALEAPAPKAKSKAKDKDKTKTAHVPSMHMPSVHMPGLHKHKDADKPQVAKSEPAPKAPKVAKAKKDNDAKLAYDDNKNGVLDKTKDLGHNTSAFFMKGAKAFGHGMASAGSKVASIQPFKHGDKEPNKVATGPQVKTTFGQVGATGSSWERKIGDNTQPNVMAKNPENKTASSSEHRSIFNKAIGKLPFIGGGKSDANKPAVMANTNPKVAGKKPKAPAF